MTDNQVYPERISSDSYYFFRWEYIVKKETKLNQLNKWINKLENDLRRLKDHNLYRSVSCVAGVDFSSNDYLSLNSSGKLREIMSDTFETYLSSGDLRAGSTGSRLVSGHHHYFNEAEEKFTQWVNAPSALFFSTGYSANSGFFSAMVSPYDNIILDRYAHASLTDGARLSGAQKKYYKHNDFNHLEEILKTLNKNRHRRTNIWIVTESIFSMDGDVVDLQLLCNIAERYDALIFLDEAHSIGIRGESGGGLALESGLGDRIAIRSFPMGKAPGFTGAFIAGVPQVREYLIQKARSFVFSTASPPYTALLMSRIIDYLQSDHADRLRNDLMNRVEYFRNNAKDLKYHIGGGNTQIAPLMVGDPGEAVRLSEICKSHNLDVRAIRPPTVPENTSRLRINIQSGHAESDLSKLIQVLSAIR